MLLTSNDLREVGQQHVTATLAALGYLCRNVTQLSGPTAIVATGPENLLVQVQASLYPAPPADLTGEERRSIAFRAANIGCQAWVAKLRVSSIGTPVGEIIWGKVTN